MAGNVRRPNTGGGFTSARSHLPPFVSSFLLPTHTVFLNYFMSAPTYPIDRMSCMTNDGPTDRRFQIRGGKLLYNAERDARFPYIYEIKTHALVHSPQQIRTILIHVVDTSYDARVECATFAKTLSVPLGPDSIMDNYGQF